MMEQSFGSVCYSAIYCWQDGGNFGNETFLLASKCKFQGVVCMKICVHHC